MADRYYEPERYGRRYREQDDRYRDPWQGGAPRYHDEGAYGYTEREQGRGRGERDERGLFERAGDEVRSWFGNDEAQRRRLRDEGEYGGYGRARGSDWFPGRRPESRGDDRRWGGYGNDEVDRDWARQWGHVERGEQRAGGGAEREQGRGRGERDERGLFERAGDEVRSWFGSDEAQRRRMRDEGERGEQPRGGGGADQERSGGSSWTGRRGYGGEGYGRESQGREGQGYGGQTSGYATWAIWAVTGPHLGRGPRGYQRSDDRIKEDICERMSQHGQLDASDIEVRVVSAEVTIEGTVPDRQAKRLAEDIAESVAGVRDVHNQVRVAQPTSGQQGQASQQGQAGEQGTQGWQGERHRAA
ncbi:MAG TPA: BON domain-containing protein [Candidatus Limnocylindria bacterium]|nr:BON domain-containing protein [Candidatus Limnocylindria bacterium]